MLAIIIPYYKKKYFAQTLQSVEKQTDKRFHLYIGNDKSPENPDDLINSLLKNTTFSYYYYKKNLGGNNLTEQWHRIIDELGDEKWLMILGDDDILGENVVEEFYNHLSIIENGDISLVKLKKTIIDEENNAVSEEPEFPKKYSSVQLIEDKMFGRRHNSLTEHIFRRDVYKKYKFKSFPLAWHSDDLALLEFAEFKDFLYIASATVYVRISSESISGQDNGDTRKSLASYQFFEYLLKNYNKRFSKEMTRLLVKRYREIIWKKGYPMNYNITNAFLEQKDYLQALNSFRIKYELSKKIKK